MNPVDPHLHRTRHSDVFGRAHQVKRALGHAEPIQPEHASRRQRRVLNPHHLETAYQVARGVAAHTKVILNLCDRFRFRYLKQLLKRVKLQLTDHNGRNTKLVFNSYVEFEVRCQLSVALI